ncbi:hypothetical protein CCMA1212_006097 [Trichoderma ghanense]|uniref:Uncharacterized protein n=1 Tax=Trichoderma ghanense TaxID=65468 RepID=A0ABY2H322_9HYPO
MYRTTRHPGLRSEHTKHLYIITSENNTRTQTHIIPAGQASSSQQGKLLHPRNHRRLPLPALQLLLHPLLEDALSARSLPLLFLLLLLLCLLLLLLLLLRRHGKHLPHRTLARLRDIRHQPLRGTRPLRHPPPHEGKHKPLDLGLGRLHALHQPPYAVDQVLLLVHGALPAPGALLLLPPAVLARRPADARAGRPDAARLARVPREQAGRGADAGARRHGDVVGHLHPAGPLALVKGEGVLGRLAPQLGDARHLRAQLGLAVGQELGRPAERLGKPDVDGRLEEVRAGVLDDEADGFGEVVAAAEALDRRLERAEVVEVDGGGGGKVLGLPEGVGEGRRELGFAVCGERGVLLGRQSRRVVAVEIEGVLVEVVLAGVVAQLVKCVQGFEMGQGLLPSAKMVVNLKLAPKLGKDVEVLNEGEIFPGVSLGLLRDKQSQVKIVQAESVLIHAVDVHQETNVLHCLFRQFFIFLHQLSNERQAVIQGGRDLADVRGDDVLEVSLLAGLEGLEDGITDGIDLGAERLLQRRCLGGVGAVGLGFCPLGVLVATRHLQHNAHVGRHGGNETRATLHAAAPLILFRVITGNFQIWAQVDVFNKVVAGGEDEVVWRDNKGRAVLGQQPRVCKDVARPRKAKSHLDVVVLADLEPRKLRRELNGENVVARVGEPIQSAQLVLAVALHGSLILAGCGGSQYQVAVQHANLGRASLARGHNQLKMAQVVLIAHAPQAVLGHPAYSQGHVVLWHVGGIKGQLEQLHGLRGPSIFHRQLVDIHTFLVQHCKGRVPVSKGYVNNRGFGLDLEKGHWRRHVGRSKGGDLDRLAIDDSHHAVILDGIGEDDCQNGRVRVPLESDPGVGSIQNSSVGRPQGKLSMAQAVALEKDDIDSVGQSLNTGNEVARRSPTQSAFKAVDGLAGTIQLSLARIHPDDSSRCLLNRVDGHVCAVSTPADGYRSVLVGARESLVDLFWYRGIPEGLGAAPLELRLLLAPSDGDVLRRLEILLRHGHLGNGVKGAAHEDDGVGLGDDGQQLLVGGPSRGRNAGVYGSHDLNVNMADRGILPDGDDVAAFQDETCRAAAAEVVKADDAVDEELGVRAGRIPAGKCAVASASAGELLPSII